MKTRQIVILLLFFAGISGIIIMLAGGMTPDTEKKDPDSKADIKYVKVKTIKKDTVEIVITSSGRVKNVHSINLSAQASGTITEGTVPLKEGQKVTKGQIVFRIDRSQEMFNLRSMKSAFMTLLANSLIDIKTDFPDRYVAWESFFSDLDYNKPLKDIPETQSTREKTFISSRNIFTEYFKIKAEEARLDKYIVKAPFSGTIKSVNQNVGANVSPGMAVVEISETSRLELILPVPISRKNQVSKNQEVTVNINDENLSGSIKRIGDIIDEKSQSINVYVGLDQNQSIYEGMFLNAKIKIGTSLDATKISDRALVNGNQAYFVKDSVLVLKDITILTKQQDKLIISDFEDNEQIVIEPIPGAVEGMKVAPIEPEE
ncbi:MAG: HlyD family efflux transporter periplasmic adaptor subunit [Flavobacteriales bacterium]|nr:HlyD family efflux transporter periplasmic adaptor subunit [Flavobacteriales bacterium]